MEITKKSVVTVMEYLDGHTIFKPEALVQDGLPKAFIDRYTRAANAN